jgi:hypothetical protein
VPASMEYGPAFAGVGINRAKRSARCGCNASENRTLGPGLGVRSKNRRGTLQHYRVHSKGTLGGGLGFDVVGQAPGGSDDERVISPTMFAGLLVRLTVWAFAASWLLPSMRWSYY